MYLANAVRNKSSQAVFVLLETLVDGKMKIINPEGKVLTVPDGLFEPQFAVRREDFDKTFSAAQIQTLREGTDKRRTTTTTRRTASRGAALVSSKVSRGEIAATWKSTRLTFFKHKIEPLRDNLCFAIEVEGKGTFVMSKAEFKKFFNDVEISNSYWRDGDFSYSDIPEKANQFLKTPS